MRRKVKRTSNESIEEVVKEKSTSEEEKKKEEKEATVYMHAVSLLKTTNAEREDLAHPGTRILDPKPQRPHQMIVLIDTESHEELIGKYSRDVGEKGQKVRVNSKGRE